MSGANPVIYAEGTLGVHDVYMESRDSLKALREAQTAAAEHAGQKRHLVEALGDREMVVTSDERAKYPEMSATAFEKHIKGVLHTDPTMKRIRGEIAACQRQIDLADAGVREHEFTLRVLCSRMEELGGLLHFYAAVKTTRQHVD